MLPSLVELQLAPILVVVAVVVVQVEEVLEAHVGREPAGQHEEAGCMAVALAPAKKLKFVLPRPLSLLLR